MTDEEIDAQQFFRKGDKVVFSKLAWNELHIKDTKMRARIGEVVGFSKEKDCVRIRWQGNKSNQTYFCGYLSKVLPQKKVLK